MLRSHYDDAHELLALAAGHETTAATLRAGRSSGSAGTRSRRSRRSTTAVTRAAILHDFAARRVNPPVYQLGEWVTPPRYLIIINIAQIHGDPDVFPQPDRFDARRKLPTSVCKILGGGTRRVGGRIRHRRWMWCCVVAAPPPSTTGRGERPRSRSCIHPEGWWRSGGADVDGSSGPRPGVAKAGPQIRRSVGAVSRAG